jgi:hypothetical protein
MQSNQNNVAHVTEHRRIDEHGEVRIEYHLHLPEYKTPIRVKKQHANTIINQMSKLHKNGI